MATVAENKVSLYNAFSGNIQGANPGWDQSPDLVASIHSFSDAFASAIADAIGAGETGGTGGVNLGDYIKKTGGITDGAMSGLFTAKSGFEAGHGATKQIETSATGIIMASDLSFANASIIRGGGKEIFRHNGSWLSINSQNQFTSGVLLTGAQTNIVGELMVGANQTSGFVTSGSKLTYKGASIYHSTNSNLPTVNWAAKAIAVADALVVGGTATFSGFTSALNGFSGGVGGIIKIETLVDGIELHGSKLYFPTNFEIVDRLRNKYILKNHGNGNISLSASGGSLYLGYNTDDNIQETNRVLLSADLHKYNYTTGDTALITRSGNAALTRGFSAGVNGDVKISAQSDGIKIVGNLFITDVGLGANVGQIYAGQANSIGIKTIFGTVDIGARNLDNLELNTTVNQFVFNKPILSRISVGIYGSQTKLANNILSLSDTNYLTNLVGGTGGISGGITHHGNSYITGTIGMAGASSGFSGTGWVIDQDAAATFTNLTVRRKLKVYEFEVEKISAINGSFWISSSCSGTIATKL